MIDKGFVLEREDGDELVIQVSIKIIEHFIKLREILLNHIELKVELEKIKKKVDNHSSNIELVFKYLDELLEKKEKPRKQIGYKVLKKKEIKSETSCQRIKKVESPLFYYKCLMENIFKVLK